MGLGVVRRGNSAHAGDSLTTARKMAHAARELLQGGVDPINERDQRRDAGRIAEQTVKVAKARDQMTLARAARDYHERVVEPARTTKHAAAWIASLERHVPEKLWHKPITDIEPPELLAALIGVRALADSEARVPETLSRIRQRLDAVFEDAIFHKRCLSNPAAAIRRKLREAQTRGRRGEFKALPYREAPAFMLRLRAMPGIAARSLEFAVLTASRTAEVLAATWDEIDVDAALFCVPGERMKSGEPHSAHLTMRALEILKAQQGLHPTLVFPSVALADRPQSNMAMLAVLDRMGMRDRTTVHGLCRATFSTWANETGAARPDVIEACLAHREADKVKAAYNRAKFTDERRVLLDSWGKYLASPSATVIQLQAA